MENINHLEEVPAAISYVMNELQEIKHQLRALGEQPHQSNQKPLSVSEAADFLHLSKHSIYRLVNIRSLIGIKRGNRLYFEMEELLEWLKKGRRDLVQEDSLTRKGVTR